MHIYFLSYSIASLVGCLPCYRYLLFLLSFLSCIRLDWQTWHWKRGEKKKPRFFFFFKAMTNVHYYVHTHLHHTIVLHYYMYYRRGKRHCA